MQSLVTGIIFTVIGIVGVAGGVLGWQILLNPAHNYSFIRSLGPTGIRAFYIVIGLFIFGVGIALLLGVLQFTSR
ncbi:MAG: hypothetical protein HY868_27295 [Chloroflexi bacterium]|nr:hypothetical protein [Chloroflexota bacterium]